MKVDYQKVVEDLEKVEVLKDDDCSNIWFQLGREEYDNLSEMLEYLKKKNVIKN